MKFFSTLQIKPRYFLVLQMIEDVLVLQIMSKDFSRLRILKIKFFLNDKLCWQFCKAQNKGFEKQVFMNEKLCREVFKTEFFSKHISGVFRVLFFMNDKLIKLCGEVLRLQNWGFQNHFFQMNFSKVFSTKAIYGCRLTNMNRGF